MPASYLFRQFIVRKQFAVQFAGLLVGAHGVFIVASTLLDQLGPHRLLHVTAITIDIPLLIGLSLVYLSSLLLRRKRNAWLVAVSVYVVLLAFNATPYVHLVIQHQLDIDHMVRALVLPVIILALLGLVRREFVVRSDLAAFRSSVKFAALIIVVALAYGTSGFLLLDEHDFHQELGAGSALHYTLDQFDLTTSHPLKPYTKRAHLFVDSLSLVSIGAATYVVISFFQPLRARWSDPAADRRRFTDLLEKYGGPSEDFFKLWPHDKHYYFNRQQTACLALHVRRGVALCLGDPTGEKRGFKDLVQGFSAVCYRNDWLPAFIHTEASHQKLYEGLGFSLQKIGQEAVVHVEHFAQTVAREKYFRHIVNRFERENYSAELLTPPHDQATLDRLKAVSDEWLELPGRTERGFVMGYFSTEYMQQCPVLVARDAAGTVQGFMNQVPALFDSEEATFDLLRHSKSSLGNSNDFLLVNFINAMASQGYKRVNLGLAPLVGLDVTGQAETLIDNFLRFAYANGDRFYSFSGLHRFKAKYQPEWRDRYIVYRDGVRGFARTMNALMRVMKVKL